MKELFAGATEKMAEKTIEKPASFFDEFEKSIEVDKPEIVKYAELVKAFWDSLESDYFSTYEERIKKTPADNNSERGHWEGDRGESKYIPSDGKINEILGKYGLNGIVYKDAIPDFSGCSEATVEIDDMSGDIDGIDGRNKKGGNFDQADQKCAEQWNKEARDGRIDWTARDVRNFRKPPDGNGPTVYTWHECNDRKTCQLVPTEVNDYFRHFGGVGECNKAHLQEDVFDE